MIRPSKCEAHNLEQRVYEQRSSNCTQDRSHARCGGGCFSRILSAHTTTPATTFFKFNYINSLSHLLCRPFFSFSFLLLVVTQTRHTSQIRDLLFKVAFLSREGLSTFFPRRLSPNCAYPRCTLSAVDFVQNQAPHNGRARNPDLRNLDIYIYF